MEPQEEVKSVEKSPSKSKEQSFVAIQELISYRLLSLCLPNNYKAVPGETLEQEYVFMNDGNIAWPADTHFIYTGRDNPLDLPEEIMIGEVLPNETIGI